MPYSPEQLIAAFVVAFVSAVLQGSIGFGYAVLGVPLLTLIDPSFTPVPVLLVALPQTVAAAVRERGQLDVEGIGWIIGGRIPGALVGAWILTVVTEQVLDGIIAVIVLAAVLSLGLGVTIRLNAATRAAAGFASGFAGTTSAIGGPPIALLYRSAEAGTIRSSLGAVFTIGILINLAALWATGVIVAADFVAAGTLLAPTLAGFASSGWVKGRIPDDRVRAGILVLAALAAAGLLVNSLG